MNNAVLHTDEIIPIRIGMQSLVGVGPLDDEPTSWGNYFSLVDPRDEENIWGIRVANFWAENLKLADRKFGLNGHVKIRLYHHEPNHYVYEDDTPERYRKHRNKVCLIDDERIPENFYYNKLCFTGWGAPSLDIIRDMFAYLGDPTNELEQFESPETYWPKHGATYKDGIIHYE